MSNSLEFESIPVNSTMQDLENDSFDLNSEEQSYNNNDFDDNEDPNNFEEITSITRINQSNKMVLKSFRDKYPMSIGLLSSLASSSASSLNSMTEFNQRDCKLDEQDQQGYNDNDDADEDLDQFVRRKSNKGIVKSKKSGSSSRDQLSKSDLNRIYKELNEIHNRLVSEHQILNEREQDLKKRESRLSLNEERLVKLTKLDHKLKFEEIKYRYENEISNLHTDLREKSKENKRLNEAYKIIKRSNETLKQQLNDKQDKNDKFEKQVTSLNSRLVNLQKKVQFNQAQTQTHTQKAESNQVTKKTMPTQKSAPNPAMSPNMLDGLVMLLEWISIENLKSSLNFNLPLSPNNAHLIEKINHILPIVADLIVNFNLRKYQLAFVEFVYWSILHLDSSFQNKVRIVLFKKKISSIIFQIFLMPRSSKYAKKKLLNFF
jgi:hypothetical protein